MRMLRRRTYNLGFRVKPMLWWPPGSLGVGIIIRLFGSSVIVDLLNLLLFCTKSRADPIVTADLV
jgi:hypothetical protein